MAIGNGIAQLDKTHRELLSIGEQLTYYASCLESGKTTDALHHSTYVGQILPWLKNLEVLLSDRQRCTQLVVAYPYWTLATLQSLHDSLVKVEATLAPHHKGRQVDGCWIMPNVRPLTIAQEHNALIAAAIRAELT